MIIGIDPHKAVHAAYVIDRNEVHLAELIVRSGPRQVGQLLDWATPFDARTWAIESAGGLGYMLAQHLLARGERVIDVPSTLPARVRLLGSGKSSKNDANDARAVAIAALRAPLLPAVRPEDHVTVLRLLAKAHLDAGRARSRACSRLHALVNELVPGGISKEIIVNQARSTLAGIEATSVVQRQRLQLAIELLDEIADLDTKLMRSKARITTAITASGTADTWPPRQQRPQQHPPSPRTGDEHVRHDRQIELAGALMHRGVMPATERHEGGVGLLAELLAVEAMAEDHPGWTLGRRRGSRAHVERGLGQMLSKTVRSNATAASTPLSGSASSMNSEHP